MDNYNLIYNNLLQFYGRETELADTVFRRSPVQTVSRTDGIPYRRSPVQTVSRTDGLPYRRYPVQTVSRTDSLFKRKFQLEKGNNKKRFRKVGASC